MVMFRSLNTGFLGFETDVETAVQAAVDGGFQGVDLVAKQTYTLARDDEAAQVRALFAENHIRPGCFALTPGNALADEAEWTRDLDGLPDLCVGMSTAGFRRALMVLLPFHGSLDYDTNFVHHRERIRQVAEVLEPSGIRLGLEYISPLTRRQGYRHHFVSDMAGALALRKAVDRPNVGIFLDCFHWYCAAETESDILALAAEDVVGVHICDAVRGRSIAEQLAFERELPGATGIIPLTPFLGALDAIGYDGPVSCEPMSESLARIPLHEAVGRTVTAMDATMGKTV